MIICHCNRITDDDINDAVGCMRSNCSNPDLCPENVYGELDVCARCCNCFPLAEKMIKEAELRFVAMEDLSSEQVPPIANKKLG